MTARGFSDCVQRLKLSDGRMRFRLRLWSGGKLYKATFPSKESAQAARDFLLAKRRAESLGIPPPSFPAEAPTVKSVFDAFERRLVNLGRSEVYRKQVAGVARLWTAFRGASASAVFTKQDLEEFVGWARRPPNTKSRGRQIRNAIMILRMVLRYSDLAVPRAPLVSVPRRAPKTVTKEQLRKYLAALPWGSVERAWAELDLRTSIRESEARALTIADVDLKARRIRVRHGKGRPGERGSEEWHPLPPGAAAALLAYREREPKDLPPEAPFLAVLARRPRGRHGLRRLPLLKESLKKRLRRACKAAGIPERGGVGWLRHQAATLARASGLPLSAASAALGHADEKMVSGVYDEGSRRDDERWSARLALGKKIDALLPLSGGPRGFGRGTKRQETGGKRPSGDVGREAAEP